MSYESAKNSNNSGGLVGETTSDMSTQQSSNNFYSPTNTNRTQQVMMMNPMMGPSGYYNGPPPGHPQAQMSNRAVYPSYPHPPPPPPHPSHQMLSPYDTYETRGSGAYYSSYGHETGVYEHQQQPIVRTYYGNLATGNFGETQVEPSLYPTKDGGLSSSTTTNNNSDPSNNEQHSCSSSSNNEKNVNESNTPTNEQQSSMAMATSQTPPGSGNIGYNNSAMMPPPHPASKQQQQQQQSYAGYSQQQGDMYGRSSSSSSAPQYAPQYPQYAAGGAALINPRSPAGNAYRPPYSSGPYQNGIGSSSGKPSSSRPPLPQQQVSPKRSNSQQPTTPPQQQQQPRYSTPYPPYSNGPVAYKPGGSNGYAPPPPPPPPPPPQSSWPPQRDVVTPSLASSTGDSDSNSSNTSQQPVSYPPPTMTNGPTTGYPPSSYNNPSMGDSTTSNNNYIDPQYSYGYAPPMNPYGGNHPPPHPPPPQSMHGPPGSEYRSPMDDDNSNVYRNNKPPGMMIDPHHPPLPPPSSMGGLVSQSSVISSNGPKSPSCTSMSSYVPDDADSSNSSFPDSPPASHDNRQQKRKLSSATSNAHSTPQEVFNKLREMGDDHERVERHIFVDRLQKLWDEHSIVCRNLPSISKQTIDLYRLYSCVREQNGFQEFSKVAKNRHWRDIASKLNIPNSSSAAFNVKQKYINLKLFHYECKYDRGGINPEPILIELEKQTGKRNKAPKKSISTTATTTTTTTNNNNNNNNINSNENINDGKMNPAQQQPLSLPSTGVVQQPGQDPYRGYPPPPHHQMHHPQQQQPPYRPMQMPMHPYGPGGEMQAPYDPSATGQMLYNNPEMDYQRVGAYPPPQQPQPQMMKPPVPTGYGMAPQHRPPGTGGPYPSIPTKTQQDYSVPQPSNLICAPPNQQAPPQQTYHYPPQQSMPSAYPPSGYPPQRTPMVVPPPQPHEPYMQPQATPTNYPYKKPECSSTPDPSTAPPTTDSTVVQDSNKNNKLLINQLRSSSSSSSTTSVMPPSSTPISILTSSSPSVVPTPPVTAPTIGPMNFPPNSVEATTISAKVKRKKLTAKDVTPVDPWKLMMSLRGGLLAETTWALDTINIMLADDQTHTYFRLKQMPGLLQAIVDIYIKCLIQLFDEMKTISTTTTTTLSSDVENMAPSLDDLNGSSHLTCYTMTKNSDSIVYRLESNHLNKYRRACKLTKEQTIVYDRVYHDQGNEKTNPAHILDLQNTDDLSYIHTHFDPLRLDDSYYEELYYGSRKRLQIDDDNNDYQNQKRRRHNSEPPSNNNDANSEFLRRHKRHFDDDESIQQNLYPNGISFDSSTQQDNAGALFTRHSLVYEQICARCTCVSSIVRNLSFILGNDIEMVKCKTLIGLLARLLLLRHGIHSTNPNNNNSPMSDNPDDFETVKKSPSFSWAECVLNIRENTLVTLANIAGALILDTFDSDLLHTLIDGLLHWSTCYSGEAIDILHSSILSAQRLAIETLAKLSVHDMNMDFVLATPPFYRIISLFHVLIDWLIVDEIHGGISNWHPSTSIHHHQRPYTHIQREFSIVLLNALVRCDALAANVIARIPCAISLLLNFLEDYEMKTNELMVRYGPDYVVRLTTQPANAQHAEQILFTTGDMLRRAASCLLTIVSYTDNINVIKRYEDRILNLSISHVIDSTVGRVLTDVLHHCSLQQHNS